MAIYHLTAKIVSRAKGQSAVASAAYRAGAALYDNRYGVAHDYSRKPGVSHSEILAPETAPDWVYDRLTLWNEVEAKEIRKDAQLAREVEIGLPIELTRDENVELLRDFVKTQFVSKGMIADFSIHEDNSSNPHAHILLTMREISTRGFGRKVRSWNAKADLLEWREAWAAKANEHLAQAGHAVRIDHRTLESQAIELTPGRKIGVGQERRASERLPQYLTDRIAEQQRIAKENGEAILADPMVALTALSRQRATFTHQDIAKFLHTRTDGADQFQAALLKVTTSKELVALGKDDWNRMRYSTREMLEAEKSLFDHAAQMQRREGHGVVPHRQISALSQHALSGEQQAAFAHVVGEGDLKAVVGVAGSGKSTLLAAARQAWEAQGLTIKGAALSGIAAENLQVASGIRSRTLASYEYAWKGGRDPLTRNDVLVIDEAGMIGTQQLERILAAADQARAKVVLVGDPEQLQAIEAGAAFRGIVGQTGMVELTQVRRQREAWAREATQALATAQTAAALTAYEEHGAVLVTDTRATAQAELLKRWAADAQAAPKESRLILAYTRDDVRDLNAAAREIRKARHELGRSESIHTARGPRDMAPNDRIVFLRNEKSLGVKNGSLGTVERIDHGVMQIKLDGKDEIRVIVDPRDYQDLDYGYASTIHKAQGSTVDRAYVLASRYFDRHTSYVALSRHREAATLFYAREEFADRGGWNRAGQGASPDPADVRQNFLSMLSRARPKDLAHDYLDLRSTDVSEASIAGESFEDTNEHRPTPDEVQAAARQRWLQYRANVEAGRGAVLGLNATQGLEQTLNPDAAHDHQYSREMPDDDMSL